MTCESPLLLKPKSERTGQKSIKKCARCKQWDSTDQMAYDVRNGFYQHVECRRVTGRNGRKIKLKAPTFTSLKPANVGKCIYCKGYDLRSNFNNTTKRFHKDCIKVNSANSSKMKPHKTDTCAFTGLPFADNSEMRPVGDHDHATLLYRGHIWSAANRLEGAAKFIMDEAGWTVDELCEALKTYLSKPGTNIGLEPYPQIGFSTPQEAQLHYGN
jgi:hypothetical protein